MILGEDLMRIGEGDVICIPPQTPHRLFNDSADWIEHLILSFGLSPEVKAPEEAVIRNWREQAPYAEGHGDQVLWPLLRHRDTPPIEWLTEAEAYCLAGDLYDISRNAIQPRGKSHMHSHQGSEQVYYVVAGQANIFLDKDKVEIQEGDIIWIDEGEEHQMTNDSQDWVEYLILTCKLPGMS
jgi:quercetin dioxygenase-like cupin family protein